MILKPVSTVRTVRLKKALSFKISNRLVSEITSDLRSFRPCM